MWESQGALSMLAEHNKEVTLPVQIILPTIVTQEREISRLKIQHTEADISEQSPGHGHSRLSGE